MACDDTGRHMLRLIAGEDNKPIGTVCVKCRRAAWFDYSDAEDCGEGDAHVTRQLGDRCAGAPNDTTTYRQVQPDFDDYAWECTTDDCDALLHFELLGPVENKVQFCPQCGRYITDVVGMEGDDAGN